ncbi:hypothetical protein SERLA73DRAFT_74250 [Serpula lacrymans var. lacrymans S7.3]|uniref:Uncharacterized protein n=2 Tax=Serpula lacrymans var. lacrymans TaxID=341189 RepID=F8Q115_SERL3|nr:uncharacterized protein SERLADRAFT_438903 [Serpula lacrymans var. lacrymans S7.9]EGN97993.1 hypothetical protein SERLA73DRAFT_74250 [Serpula lacrymans var. lacrymans S7.3]EGO23585.1 hypothetical protein SERLADRAFT_438903 [Serpula lacrymans var. lacrymans S7.9]
MERDGEGERDHRSVRSVLPIGYVRRLSGRMGANSNSICNAGSPRTGQTSGTMEEESLRLICRVPRRTTPEKRHWSQILILMSVQDQKMTASKTYGVIRQTEKDIYVNAAPGSSNGAPRTFRMCVGTSRRNVSRNSTCQTPKCRGNEGTSNGFLHFCNDKGENIGALEIRIIAGQRSGI